MSDNNRKVAYDKSNVALELPTGVSKTLISLLIGEFRRKKNKGKSILGSSWKAFEVKQYGFEILRIPMSFEDWKIILQSQAYV